MRRSTNTISEFRIFINVAGCLFLMVFFHSCRTNRSFNYADFMKSGGDTSLVREYTSFVTDSSIKRIFLKQSEITLNDTLKISYIFYLKDGFPVSSGIEYFYPDKSYELIAHSLYESDSAGNPVELKAEIIKGGRQSLENNPIRYTLQYNFRSDTQMSLEAETEIFCKQQFVDSLDTECLLISTIDKFSFGYFDERKDTSGFDKTFRLYVKGKGLTRFENESDGIKSVYNLTNKY